MSICVNRVSITNVSVCLTLFRRIASNVPDIGVQLDVFDEQRECDESQSLQGPDGINLNSHLDVFYAILRQVSSKNRGQLNWQAFKKGERSLLNQKSLK